MIFNKKALAVVLGTSSLLAAPSAAQLRGVSLDVPSDGTEVNRNLKQCPFLDESEVVLDETALFLEETGKNAQTALSLEDSSNTLFQLPPGAGIGTNIIDFLSDEIDKIINDLRNDPNMPQVLFPTVVREDDEDNIKDLGANVKSCRLMDVVAMDAFAFGYHMPILSPFGSPVGSGLCAAFNPCEHVYVLSQVGLLPDFEIVPKLVKVSADAIGFSLKRGGLELESANEMWKGDGDAAKLAVPGHFYLAGTGKVGMELSKGIKATFKLQAEMILDVDPNNNGMFQPLGHESTDKDNDPIEVVSSSQIPLLDLALLASGTQFAEIALTTGKHDYVVNLSDLAKTKKDLYIKIDDDYIEAQYASGVEVSLQKLCDISRGFSPICQIFDANSGISGRANAFFNTNGDFGLMLKIQGKFALGGNKGDIIEMFGGKDISFSGSAEVSLKIDNGRLELCMNLNDGTFDQCLGNCVGDSDCDSDEFCNPITSLCRPKRDNGFFPCLADSQCESGRCVDTTRVCAAKKSNGKSCAAGRECVSGHCNGLFQCADKINKGENGWGPCSKDSQCDSGRCVDTTRICASKKRKGQSCASGKECSSGTCKFPSFKCK